MKHERKAREAMHEYVRLAAILNDEHWTDAALHLLEEQIGRPILSGDGVNRHRAARDAFDQAIVDVVADALEAGVSRQWLLDHRGWLSLNDVREYIGHALEPQAYNYRPAWLQRTVLEAVRTDVATVAGTAPDEAARLLRASKGFLRRWVQQIPSEPSEQDLAVVAARWRSVHVELWQRARSELLKEVEELSSPKDTV
jgi:hypothetical protein